jgi:hypothetical protein
MLFWNSAGFPRQTATKTVLAPARILTDYSPYRPPPFPSANYYRSTLEQPPRLLGCQIQLVSLGIKLQYAFINLTFL